MTDQELPGMPEVPEEPHHMPFAAWLQQQAGGSSHDDLTDGLAKVVAAVKATGKKGTLTYTIVVEPVKKATNGTLSVTDQIKIATPQPDRRVSIFYGDDNGTLHREDPNQMKLTGLKAVEATAPVTADQLKKVGEK